MEESYFDEKPEAGFFSKNKMVIWSVIISSMICALAVHVERHKTVENIIPVLRGEVSLGEDFVITTIKNKSPILIKKDDPFVGSQLRFSGDIKSLFSVAADSLCKPKDVVLEVGAHFGYNAINLGNHLRHSGKYYAFEANHTVFSCLKKSIALNDLVRVIFPKCIAISGHVGACSIDDCISMKALPQGGFTKPNVIHVKCSTIDTELADEASSVTLLLIDIPGLEFPIINGAKKAIHGSRHIKIIVSFDNEASSSSCDVQEELKKLAAAGFKFYVIEAPNVHTPVDIPEIISRGKAVLVITRDDLR
ncbi:MAG: FkbM family methyltransferase [Holosporaceae bacterium]|nr:FkbM family methyltransferase [Holosporaceae bacterium]